jgi:hypothetical protein
MNDEVEHEVEVFHAACDKVRKSVEGLEGLHARLALAIVLAECVVFGSSDDEPQGRDLRLAFAMESLSSIAADIMTDAPGDDDGGEDDEGPVPSSPDPLRKLLDRRRKVRPL